MRIAVGADHAGVALKDALTAHLDARGITYTDFGIQDGDAADYPDIAATVAREVAAGHYERGLLVCGSGTGMAMAANKVAGIRAAAVFDERAAALSREHNDANVLTLGGRLVDTDVARRSLDAFLDTDFAGGRHARRVGKINALDHG